MKKQIRPKVFETNSSSSHSLVIADTGDLMPIPFSESIMENGIVTIYSGEYGWEIERYNSVYDKMSYLYTDAMLYSDATDTPDPESNNKLRMLIEAIKEHTGCDVEFERSGGYWPYGYIDHQSVGLCSDVWSRGIEGVKQFVFNPNSYFETDNDNH